jgi:AmmeMemoRadiSam system protein B
MGRVRPPAVAGMFYPDDPVELEAMVRRFLAEGAGYSLPTPKALIVPHAGYMYSGPVAGTAYATVADAPVERILLVGPSHYVWFSGLAHPDVEAFATPLGLIPVADPVFERAPVVHSPEAHAREHSLEVQLPFLQVLFGTPEIVPLVVGDAAPEDVAGALEEQAEGSLILISSDLSHYLTYDEARLIDAATSQSIVDLDPNGLHRDSACGVIGIQGMLLYARRHGLRCVLLDLRNSGDTAGGHDRVVGYGAFAFLAES